MLSTSEREVARNLRAQRWNNMSAHCSNVSTGRQQGPSLLLPEMLQNRHNDRCILITTSKN